MLDKAELPYIRGCWSAPDKSGQRPLLNLPLFHAAGGVAHQSNSVTGCFNAVMVFNDSL